jgi:hypothetical protein
MIVVEMFSPSFVHMEFFVTSECSNWFGSAYTICLEQYRESLMKFMLTMKSLFLPFRPTQVCPFKQDHVT